MEAQIALVTAELRRLQAAEGSVPPGRPARTENTSAGRAAHLEEQLNILIQQRLQHLETIQCQQIQLQVKMARSLSRSGDAESAFYIFDLFDFKMFFFFFIYLFHYYFYLNVFYLLFYYLYYFFCLILFCFLFCSVFYFSIVLFCLVFILFLSLFCFMFV